MLLETEISLVHQLTDKDIKTAKQDIETDKYQYIIQTKVQTLYEKEFNRKHTKDRNMLTSSFSQHDWTKQTDSLTNALNRAITGDIIALFEVIPTTHITDILIKDVLTDSFNCDNFLNKKNFYFLTESLTDFHQTITIVNKRLYGEALFHIFSQNEIYSNTYKTDRIMIDFVKFLNSSPSNFERLHHNYSYTTTQQGYRSVQRKVCFIRYTLNFKNDFSQKHISKRILKRNLKELLHENVYSQNNISRHNLFPEPHLQTNINNRSSKADMKGKGKAPAVQPRIRKPSVKISDRHEGVSIETISL